MQVGFICKKIVRLFVFEMKTLSKIELFSASSQEVFNVIDDLGVTGMHMTESSMMMMGSKLNLEYLSENHTGLYSKYRWTGKMLGLKMNFTVEVTKWIISKEKVWQTIGVSKMIIFSWYQMHLLLMPLNEFTKAELSITYTRPQQWYYKIISFLFADSYCRWCLKSMLRDARGKLRDRVYTFN